MIREGHLPDGFVDERSIEDVRPDELVGYTQCHFFAGIGGWPLALRLAGWPDERPVWTGSCPCQPFSQAGARKGADDERHLWPAFRWLIDQCRPAAVFGEQVASKAGREWLSGVRIDLEAMAYAVGAADLCAAGVGAPHIRQRLFWVADGAVVGREMEILDTRGGEKAIGIRETDVDGSGRASGGVADTSSQRRQQIAGSTLGNEGAHGWWQEGDNEFASHGEESGGLADSTGRGLGVGGIAPGSDRFDDRGGERGRMVNSEIEGLEKRVDIRGSAPEKTRANSRERSWFPGDDSGLEHAHSRGWAQGHASTEAARHRPSAFTTGWNDFICIPCADGKSRRIEPGIAPLAHGIPARVVRLRGYGNAIVPQLAATFVRAVM